MGFNKWEKCNIVLLHFHNRGIIHRIRRYNDYMYTYNSKELNKSIINKIDIDTIAKTIIDIN